MKKILLFILLVPAVALAQRKETRNFLEVGAMLGLTSYSGDLVTGPVELNETQLGYGIFGRYHFTNKISAKVHVYSGSITGDDANSKSLQTRSIRFSTSILELGAVGEYKFLGRDRISETGLHVFHFTPYVFAGAAFVIADPEAEYYGPPERAPELPEPGLTKNFISTPVGIGLRVDYADRYILGAEGGWRPVYNDGLDGVSINGNPDNNDWYYFLGLTFSFVVNNPRKNAFE
jgi:hypothetical protein